MDRKAMIIQKRFWIVGGVVIGLVFAALAAGSIGLKSFHGHHPLARTYLGKTIAGTPLKDWSLQKLVNFYVRAWESFIEKARAIREVHEDNAKLRTENTLLKTKLETLEFSLREKQAKISTQKKEMQLSKETGSKTGRTLASLSYKPPLDLLPPQLYTLGISYFNAHEDEKAAVIFTSLANLTDTDLYRSAKHLVATGVAWYRIENFSLADSYFNEVLKKPETDDNLRYQAQARLWKALIAKKMHKEMKSQYWLRDLLDHHPHAPEVSWINPVEVKSEKSLDP